MKLADKHLMHCFNIYRDKEMLELAQAVLSKQHLLYKDPNFTWLFALLSSSSTFTTQLYMLHSSILSQIIDYLYHSSLNETTNVSEVVICVTKL